MYFFFNLRCSRDSVGWVRVGDVGGIFFFNSCYEWSDGVVSEMNYFFSICVGEVEVC